MKKHFITVSESGDREFNFDRPGLYLVFFYNISGALRFNILSEGVDLQIFGLFMGQKKENFNLSTFQIHSAPLSTSNLFVKGVFRDNSSFIYEGLIRIEKQGNGCHAYQKNQNYLLSKDAFVSSKPDLEILAQDVFCTHGSTTGRPNRKDIFYIQSRGLDEKASIGLLVYGFVQDLFSRMERLGFEAESQHYKKLIIHNYA